MNQEKMNLSIDLPMAGFDSLALRRLSGLVAAHAGLSFERTPEDTLRFDLGERAPGEAMGGAAFISGLLETARNGQTALYCRTASPDPDAIARQRETLQRFAVAHSFGNTVCYEDDGCSALGRTRPAFSQMEEDIRGGKIQRVLAKSLTRLGRNSAEVVRWALWLRRHGAEVIILDPPVDINAALEVLENA